VSMTPFPLRLLVVARCDPLPELRVVVLRRDAVLVPRFDPLPAALALLLVERAVVFADGLRAAGFLDAGDRFVLPRAPLVAIEFPSPSGVQMLMWATRSARERRNVRKLAARR
jgi:hypothetical protein